ncbi:hypothetical protein LJC19_04650 [Oxalobacter sp. OttesenSCG-928-P03]|nr:hypothetical protein [Oxalobacter sp. OttesenSCG-928-P03]
MQVGVAGVMAAVLQLTAAQARPTPNMAPAAEQVALLAGTGVMAAAVAALRELPSLV